MDEGEDGDEVEGADERASPSTTALVAPEIGSTVILAPVAPLGAIARTMHSTSTPAPFRARTLHLA